MDCYSSRLTSQLTCYLIALAIACFINYLSAYFFFPHNPTGSIAVHRIFDLTVNPYLQADQSSISIKLDADLRSAFQWNTHQLFVFVKAKYSTPDHHRNEIIVWDSIVSSKDEALLNYRGVMSKYLLRDRLKNLKSTDIELELGYRYMPLVGAMKEYSVATSKFKMPKEYFKHDTRKRGSNEDYDY